MALESKLIIEKNVNWFLNSGILRDEGMEGVDERVWLLHPSHPIVGGNKLLQDGIFKYRRVDCALETAVALELASRQLSNPKLSEIAKNLVDFVTKYDFQEKDPQNPELGLYAHGLTTLDALPQNMKSSPGVKKGRGTYWNKKWVDDNSWAVIAPLYLWATNPSYPDEVAINALVCAEALLGKRELLVKACRGNMDGVPHWGGMRNMALAQVYSLTKDERFKDEVLKSMKADFEKIDAFKRGDSPKPYDLSNTSYAVFQMVSIARSLKNEQVRDALGVCVDYLVRSQHQDGHFAGEWWEGSKGEHIADLVYGQNWAVNALQMYPIKDAFKKAQEFLAQCQIDSPSHPLIHGAWMGSYDTSKGSPVPGGDDKKEGGPSHVYSGWTNAPILTSFAADALGIDHPYFGAQNVEQSRIDKVYAAARAEYNRK